MNLTEKRQEIKKLILENSFKAGACHISSALSCVNILVDLFYIQKIKPEQFIFSKASGISVLYAILADKGYFPKNKIAYYLKNYPLPSKEVPGVIWSGGSLGMGLSIAAGIALGNRKKRIYVLLSDGEMQEGNTFEAALFARQHNLNNLYAICDNNQYQALGKIKDILDLETAFDFYKKTLPHFERVKTIKGGNIGFLQGTKGHYLNLTEATLKQSLKWI